jgi:hypothetical protein
MVADPFFCLKIAHLKATVHTIVHLHIYVKSGPPDPADFATTWHLIHWRFLALCAMVWATVVILRPAQKKPCQSLPAVAYRAKPLGISRCDVRDRPPVGPTIAQSATVGELDAES